MRAAARDGRKRASSDQTRNDREAGEEKDTRPGRSSEITSSSDTGSRHASSRQSADDTVRPPAQNTGRSSNSDAPVRGSAGTGKEE